MPAKKVLFINKSGEEDSKTYWLANYWQFQKERTAAEQNVKKRHLSTTLLETTVKTWQGRWCLIALWVTVLQTPQLNWRKRSDSPNILPEYLQAVRQSCWLLFTSTGTLTAAVSLTSYESEWEGKTYKMKSAKTKPSCSRRAFSWAKRRVEHLNNKICLRELSSNIVRNTDITCSIDKGWVFFFLLSFHHLKCTQLQLLKLLQTCNF